VARQAALAGEREELADPVVRIALGRLPEPVDVAEREGWAAREHERRERVWERVQPPPLDEVPPQIEHLDRPLAELGLSDRTAQVLVDAGLRTLADLCTRREVDLIRLPNFERQQLKEIKAILADFGLSLGMSLG
jgi:DNA-directed RNA polymerase alpha subunit